MDDIYFKKVIARGPGKKESSVEFKRGLNIICGPSNAGKTLIFKIFKQVFGSDNKKYANNDDEPFIIENDTGYTEFSLVISKNGDEVILTRKVDSEIINVDSHSKFVKPGDYAYTAKKGYELINDALLQIFGVDAFKLPKNKDGTSAYFSFKFLDYLFFADEGRIDEGKQILLAKSNKYNATTQSMANLLYLIYDMDFSRFLKNEDLDKVKLRRGAVRKYINTKLENNENEIKRLKNQLKEFSVDENDSSEIQKRLDSVRKAIDSKYKENTNLEEIIKTLSGKIESDGILIDRLESLAMQYKSDLERLNFIVAGKSEMDKNETEHECPYCHSKIHEEKEQISLSEIEHEANYAIHNLNGVSETLSNLLKEHDKDEKELEINKKKLSDVNQVINKLVDERLQLERLLRQFDELIECQKRIEYLQDDNEKLGKDLIEVSGQLKVDREDFVPTECFQPSFYRSMTENIKAIMQYCGDHRYVSAEFDKDTFDISIRGQSKSANNGKGFRAFVNSITLLSFRKFLDEKGKHQLPVYVIDSPLKNLDVGGLDKDNIKDNFFKYLIHASDSGQMIIIENTNNFTMTEELKEKANVIEFTHGTKEGRYGFLYDYHD